MEKFFKYLALWFAVFISVLLVLLLKGFSRESALGLALIISVISIVVITIFLELFNILLTSKVKRGLPVLAYTEQQLSQALLAGVLTFAFVLVGKIISNGGGFSIVNIEIALLPAIIAFITVVAAQLNIPLPTSVKKT